jgi:hypothetical protein|uniref:ENDOGLUCANASE E n=1 Tax=Siphoviridae sp. ctUWs1 TaxID=2826352 RepID=A0A8S5QV79_9CAUD|nr:MAG TPA: ENDOGLUCANASE E [Siphoviridae sp. ctUWs1]
MADRTWYSKSKADEVFATKAEVRSLPSPDLSAYATKAEVGRADDEIRARVDGLSSSAATKAELADYAKAADVASVYATKEALTQAQLGGGGQAPDLSSYLTRSDASSTYVTKSDAQATYPTKSEVASTYATKSELAQAGGGSPSPEGAPLAALPLRAGQGIPAVGFFGDSWSTESTMGQGFNLPSVVSRALGCVPVFSAVDGSGFGYSASGRDGFEVDSRVNVVCAAAPNLIVTIGSLNADKVIDNGDATGVAITEAVKSFVTKVRAKLPQVPIVVLGPQPSSVARLQSRSAHVNVKATKAGVEASGGLGNGIAFVDWLGVVDGQAVPWRDGRACAEGDVVVYNGVAYRVTRAWVPASGETPLTVGAPTVQVSDVLSGTGNSGAPKGDGTRDTLLLSDETHPTKMGAAAFGVAAAKRIGDAVASLASWAKAQGPVVPAVPAAPPAPPPAQGDGLPVMAWLSGGWGNPNRVAYSMTDLLAVAALKPSQVAVPLRGVADTADLAVGIPDSFVDKDSKKREFSNVSIQGAKSLGLDVAGLVESLNMFEDAGIEVLPNVRNGLADSGAEYYKSSDGKCFTVLASRAGKTYQEIHGRGQTKLRGIMKAQYPAIVRVVDATDATADWHLTDPIKDAQKGILSAPKAGAGVWGAAKTTFPDGVWVLVESKDEQETAKSAAQAAGVTIVGWAVGTPEALAAIKG